MDVSAAPTMTIAIEMIIGDDQIGGAAADIDRCDGYSFTLRAVGSAKGVENDPGDRQSFGLSRCRDKTNCAGTLHPTRP